MQVSHYTARAIKATALLEETRALLRAWRPGESAEAFRARLQNEDPLGKDTASRRDVLVRVAFIDRFLRTGQEPASSLRRLLDRRGNGRWFTQLCLLYAARADIVLREAITEFLPARRARGAETVRTPDFLIFLDEQEAHGRMIRPWSRSVRESVAQHILHQLTDLGVLGAPRRGIRPILGYRPGSLGIVWLACDLHREGCTDAALVDHPDFLLWQMQGSEVRDALARLSDLGLWVYQGAGSVVRITWRWSCWEDVLTVLEGPAVD